MCIKRTISTNLLLFNVSLAIGKSVYVDISHPTVYFSKSVDHDGKLRGTSSGPPIYAAIVAKNSNTSKSVSPILNMRKPTRKSSSTNMGKHFPAKDKLLFNMNLHLTL